MSQAELEGKVTGRYAPQLDTAPGAQPAPRPNHAQAQAQEEELEAWINADEIESIDDDVGLERMVPITERPPAPSAPPPRRVATRRMS
jgi:hypothetical protein